MYSLSRLRRQLPPPRPRKYRSEARCLWEGAIFLQRLNERALHTCRDRRPRLSVTIKYRNRYLLGAFFFEAKGTKKKAWQKRNAVLSGLCAPNPHHLLKKVDENLRGASRGGGRKLKIAPPKTKIGARKKPAATGWRQACYVSV